LRQGVKGRESCNGEREEEMRKKEEKEIGVRDDERYAIAEATEPATTP